MNGHTYPFEPGLWKTKGHFWDRTGKIIPVEGETRVAHGPEAWSMEARMTLLGQQIEIFNDYRIVPFGCGQRCTTWVSENPALGRLEGTFTIVADTIISLFRSEDGRFHGSEVARMHEPTTYHCRGMVMKGGELVSSWSVALQRAS